MKPAALALLLLSVLFFVFRFCTSPPEIKNANPTSAVIVCFGDSLTHGTGAEKGKDFPAQLSTLLGKDIINAGIPGDTTAMALARLDLDVLSHAPGYVLITLGGNDLMKGVSRDEAFTNLRKIVQKIQESGAMVVVGGVRFAFLDRGFASGYEELCKETASLCVPDILGGIMNDPALMSDRIHPNSAGYAIVAERFYNKIMPYINKGESL